MKSASRFDAIVIGTGQAGPSLAAKLSAAGMSVAVIERKLFGGTCVNAGCTPTKTLVASAAVAYQARRAAQFGIRVENIAVDMPAVMARKDAVVAASRTGLEQWLRGLKHCSVYNGHARFRSAGEIQVGGEVLQAPKVFINVGGRPVAPSMPGSDAVPCLTSTSILQLQSVPPHLLIVGGSYIGLEFAQIFRRLGSEVTVIEKGPRLAGREDEDVSAAITDIFTREGIRVRTSAECIRFAMQGARISAHVDCTSGEPEISGSHVLLAIGRRPNTDDLGLESAGVAVDERGYIAVDEELKTNVAGIWALGDCNGRGAFTHTAYNDFEIVAANLLSGGSRRVSDRIPCYGLFIDPPLGRVGMTEAMARAAKHRIRVGSRPMTRVGRAVEKGETLGFMKIVVDADTDRILGASILGVGGDEAVHGIVDIMAADTPYTTLQHTMHIHPTVSELIPTVLGELTP
jgi:pyruvate/2-oxoglutarate dehydrogenase complex dihydrolipoamide dehydrogenase (E3) component